MKLDGFNEAVKGVRRLAGVQQCNAHVVEQLVLVVTPDGQQGPIGKWIS